MNLDKIKSLFLKVLIGCLVAAAALAVVTILAGHFNNVSAKALLTILLIAIHALVSFGFIVNNEKQETFESLDIFANATFIVIVLSFITSVFGVWGIVPGDLVAKMYALYFVLLFAILHGEVLTKTLGKQSNINTIVYANYSFMLIVILLLIPVIFVGGNGGLAPLYYRFLAVFGIIDATLTLVAIILHKLYVQKHPKINDPVFNVQQYPGQIVGQNIQAAAPPAKRHMNIFVIILIGYVVIQIGGAIFVAILGRLYSK